jgi:hypothetical protein
MFRNKPTNAALCAMDRRQREDNAPRLVDLLPKLSALSIRVDEHSTVASPKYVRRIVVRSAPAVFLLPCSDANCTDGGHDISGVVMIALRAGQRAFTGSHECTGWIGSNRCSRMIWFEGEAEYVAS